MHHLRWRPLGVALLLLSATASTVHGAPVASPTPSPTSTDDDEIGAVHFPNGKGHGGSRDGEDALDDSFVAWPWIAGAGSAVAAVVTKPWRLLGPRRNYEQPIPKTAADEAKMAEYGSAIHAALVQADDDWTLQDMDTYKLLWYRCVWEKIGKRFRVKLDGAENILERITLADNRWPETHAPVNAFKEKCVAEIRDMRHQSKAADAKAAAAHADALHQLHQQQQQQPVVAPPTPETAPGAADPLGAHDPAGLPREEKPQGKKPHDPKNPLLFVNARAARSVQNWWRSWQHAAWARPHAAPVPAARGAAALVNVEKGLLREW
ncbi:MAG: hypothetical protein M1826_000212 [Phylliscum demangeonii]|nr:MAG: hypothetical protein M1826_000212 [Phylliscum demangeonii]